MAWISKHIHHIMWDVITSPCLNFNNDLTNPPRNLGHGCVTMFSHFYVGVIKNNFISHFTGDVINYLCWDLSFSMFVKGATGWNLGFFPSSMLCMGSVQIRPSISLTLWISWYRWSTYDIDNGYLIVLDWQALLPSSIFLKLLYWCVYQELCPKPCFWNQDVRYDIHLFGWIWIKL